MSVKLYFLIDASGQPFGTLSGPVQSFLEELGVDVYGMGEPLTKALKGDTEVMAL